MILIYRYEAIHESLENLIDGAAFEHSKIGSEIEVSESTTKFRKKFYAKIEKYEQDHSEMMDHAEDLGIEPIIINRQDTSDANFLKEVYNILF